MTPASDLPARPEAPPRTDVPVRTVLRVVSIVVSAALLLYLIFLLRKPIGWLLMATFIAVALSAPGTWTYVFGDLTAESGIDVVTGARLLAHSADGLMPWRGRPEPLKRGMVARIPPFDFTEERS